MLGVMHWRAVFVVFGAVGFVWALVWYGWFRNDPSQHPAVSGRELSHIQQGRGAIEGGHHLDWATWKRLLANRSLIALCLMYFTQGYGFYFYITWLPTYLEKERGFTSLSLGALAGLPLMLSVLADLFGGLTTDRLTKRFGLRVGRCGVGGVALLLAGVLLITGTAARDPLLAAVLISLASASSNFLLGASWGTCIDIAGNHAGVVSACMNTAGQVGGVLSPIVIALVVERFANWSAPLYLAGLLYLCGAACWWLIEPCRPILSDQPAPGPAMAATP